MKDFGGNDLFIKFLVGMITASAIKMAADLGDIKTTVAVAVSRIEAMEVRLHSLEIGDTEK